MKDGEALDGDHVLKVVAPNRRETVRRRIAALEEYEALPNRNWRDLDRLCRPLDLSPQGFMRLWRSWRTLRDPAALQGPSPARGRTLRTDDLHFVREAVRRIPTEGSIESRVTAIEALARDEGVPLRSRSALRRLVREIVEQDEPAPLLAQPASVVAVDMVPIEIVVDEGGGPRLPLAAVVLHPASGTVMAALLSLGAPGPAAAAAVLRRWLAEDPFDPDGAAVDEAIVPASRDGAWTPLFDLLARRGVKRIGPDGRRAPVGSIVEASVGRQLLGIDTRPRMAHRSSAERRPLVRSPRLNRPLSLAEAQAVLDERVAATPRPALSLTDADLLAEDLAAMSDG